MDKSLFDITNRHLQGSIPKEPLLYNLEETYEAEYRKVVEFGGNTLCKVCQVAVYMKRLARKTLGKNRNCKKEELYKTINRCN